jgi:cytochrome c-type biogenesis protein CcmF
VRRVATLGQSAGEGSEFVAWMRPEKRFYPVQQMPMTEAAIDRGFGRDLYVSLGERTQEGAFGVRVQIKPFMSWIWGGCILMALGGALSAADRRYRLSKRKAVDDSHDRQVLPAVLSAEQAA